MLQQSQMISGKKKSFIQKKKNLVELDSVQLIKNEDVDKENEAELNSVDEKENQIDYGYKKNEDENIQIKENFKNQLSNLLNLR